MSRRKSGQSVSLFPFLAVLVSAMGALILLLLVTTRKLREDAINQAKADQVAQAELDAQAERPMAPMPLPDDDPAFSEDAAEYVITVPSPAKQLLPPAPPPEPDRSKEREALREQWQNKLAELQQNWDRLQKRVQQGQLLLTSQKQQDDELAAELETLQARIDQLLAERGEISNEAETTEAKELTLAQKVAVLKAELERLKAEKKEQADKFQLVPYAGSSPTRRRPIIIECDAKAVRFASEEISLSARDLSGFNSQYNPVRAGTDALFKYWETQRIADKSAASALQPEPYLLFVIRPGGTVSYYVARRMLEGMTVDSGYELVAQSQELVWPVSTPEAKSECQSAINEVLAVRNRMASSTPDGRIPVTRELQFEGAEGEFVLEEVQKLRNPSQKLVFGSQRVTRRERPRMTDGSAYKPPSAPDDTSFVGPRLDDLRDELGRMPPRRIPEREARSADRGQPNPHRHGQPDSDRPFPIEPPPRVAQGRNVPKGNGNENTPQGAGATSNGLKEQPLSAHDKLIAGTDKAADKKSPGRLMKPGWETSGNERGLATDETELVSPEELARRSKVSPRARGVLGQYDQSPGDTTVGRGQRDASTDGTSATGDEGELQDLLSSNTSSKHQPLEPHPPTNSSKPRGQTAGVPDGHPGGDQTSATETTTDPAMAGDSKPEGVVGGKGTWSGEGSSAAAPDSVPVQPGATNASTAEQPTGQKSVVDPTEEAIARHTPRPWPIPSSNSITAERFVDVTVDAEQVHIGNRSIPIEFGTSDQELVNEFSRELAKMPERWGRAPRGFHWQPTLRFKVRPGGNLYFTWLQAASQDWGLKCSVEYVLE